jgi:hypothetical protein
LYVLASAGSPESVSAIAKAIAFLNLLPHFEGTLSGEFCRVLIIVKQIIILKQVNYILLFWFVKL